MSYKNKEKIFQKLGPTTTYFTVLSAAILFSILGWGTSYVERTIFFVPEGEDWAWKAIMEYWPNRDAGVAWVMLIAGSAYAEFLYHKKQRQAESKKEQISSF